MQYFFISILLALVTITNCHAQGNDTSKTFQAYRIVWQGNSYSVLTIDPQQFTIKIETQHQEQGFAYLKHQYDSLGKELLFAMNAGMFHKGGTPVGLLIDSYTELSPLTLKVDTNQRGNFYALPPNGMFWLDSSNIATVCTTPQYPIASNGKKVQLATQSGPMLVYGGTLNKAFRKGSSNLNIRNGVGVTDDGKVVFMISDVEVNFYDMATLYRDSLKCNNALYLDGSISRMYLPEIDRNKLDDSGHLHPIITITQKP